MLYNFATLALLVDTFALAKLVTKFVVVFIGQLGRETQNVFVDAVMNVLSTIEESWPNRDRFAQCYLEPLTNDGTLT